MEIEIKKLIGLTEQEAIDLIASARLRSRVRRRDGKSFMGTMEMANNRVNLEVEEGKVVKAYIG